MTFEARQVRAITAPCAASAPQGVKALRYINHSDIVITAALPPDSLCRFLGILPLI